VFGEVLRENAAMLQMVHEFGFVIAPGDETSILRASIDPKVAAPPPHPR
jgi:hypothetical protein